MCVEKAQVQGCEGMVPIMHGTAWHETRTSAGVKLSSVPMTGTRLRRSSLPALNDMKRSWAWHTRSYTLHCLGRTTHRPRTHHHILQVLHVWPCVVCGALEHLNFARKSIRSITVERKGWCSCSWSVRAHVRARVCGWDVRLYDGCAENV